MALGMAAREVAGAAGQVSWVEHQRRGYYRHSDGLLPTVLPVLPNLLSLAPVQIPATCLKTEKGGVVYKV